MTQNAPSHDSAQPTCAGNASQEASPGGTTLRALVVEHHAALFRYAYRLTGQQADAEDLTQQAFLVAQQKLHQLREPERARAWLFAVLRSCFLKNCRKWTPDPGGLWEAEEVAAETPSLDAIDQQGLAEALAELPDEFRIVVLMFYFEDLSYKEIAEQLELPIGTVMSRLSRAKGHLRRRLADDWTEDPGVAPSTVSPSKLSRRDSSTRSTNGAHPSSPSRTSNPT